MLDELLGRAELKDRIEDLEEEKRHLERRAAAEEERRSEAARKRQEADAEINRLEDRVEGLEERVERLSESDDAAVSARGTEALRRERRDDPRPERSVQRDDRPLCARACDDAREELVEVGLDPDEVRPGGHETCLVGPRPHRRSRWDLPHPAHPTGAVGAVPAPVVTESARSVCISVQYHLFLG